ncbi:MAG: hypothetical protein GWN07_35560, partial [Actinobacteria bacterium]|nr:hypothetical protein [Actinomycetota bacterium]NIS31455.1 hypothetical protein [Actinomycetota bacterium]NIU66573.1 hypothetical protein [Actinomycetota bacterium]NIV90102.1 hypothetical protein [Actinomycetota bacterium]NIW28377.1 hypothetical protein [Actinomycetota bacterium]
MPPKHPAATVEHLLTSLLAAGGAGDVDAWSALSADEAIQSLYLVTEGKGRLMEPSPMAEWDPEADPLREMEVIGEPLIVGDAAAIAVRCSLPAAPVDGGEG